MTKHLLGHAEGPPRPRPRNHCVPRRRSHQISQNQHRQRHDPTIRRGLGRDLIGATCESQVPVGRGLRPNPKLHLCKIAGAASYNEDDDKLCLAFLRTGAAGNSAISVSCKS